MEDGMKHLFHPLRKKFLLRPLFENRVWRRIFGTRREEVAGGWRRLDNEFITCMLHQILLG
jgi:hypothetical protein